MDDGNHQSAARCGPHLRWRVARSAAEAVSVRERLRDENAYLRRELQTLVGAPAIVGNSASVRRLLEQVRQVAASDASVLLMGETGTGKSLLANRIHELSARHERAMVRVNCASLSVSSVEGDLFGREQMAYGCPTPRSVGLLEIASGSTVFLDEVADLPADTQASLARVLQNQEIHPLGTRRAVKVDLRVIAATRRDLLTAIRQGTFRDDLFYRLNVLPIHVPPLRERVEDIPLLVWRFVDEFGETYGKTIDTIDQESMALLQRYHWPGNARELRNVVERAVLVTSGRRLQLASPTVASAAGKRADETLLSVEKRHISEVLAGCHGKVHGKDGAAHRLGLSPRALEAKLTALGLRRLANRRA
jgi:formate hydrogenlyase transcriptional activator